MSRITQNLLKFVFTASIFAGLISCESSTGSTDDSLDDTGSKLRSLPLNFTADLSKDRQVIPSIDDYLPGGFDPFAEGTDLDQDGGISRHNTPVGFSVAIKKLTAVHEDGSLVDLIPDRGTLQNAVVLNLVGPKQLTADSAYSGRYTSITAEFYYYDIEMEINTASNFEELRIYLSDDDFSPEGSLGHHQGDIQLKKSDGTYSWIQAGAQWNKTNLDDTRPSVIGGAASADPQSGHDRGLFGNDLMWNDAIFMQGASADIFRVTAPIDFTIPESGGTLDINFDLANTWYYEDFDNNQVFNPCIGNEACADGADWHPTFPTPTFAVILE